MLKSVFKSYDSYTYYQGLNTVMSVVQRATEDPKDSMIVFEGLVNNYMW